MAQHVKSAMSLTKPASGRLSERTYRAQGRFRSGLRAYYRVAEENARRAGIMPQQYLALLAIRGRESYPRVTVGQVATALQLRASSASLLLNRMVDAGLVDRREDTNDRRRACVSLT